MHRRRNSACSAMCYPTQASQALLERPLFCTLAKGMSIKADNNCPASAQFLQKQRCLNWPLCALYMIWSCKGVCTWRKEPSEQLMGCRFNGAICSLSSEWMGWA